MANAAHKGLYVFQMWWIWLFPFKHKSDIKDGCNAPVDSSWEQGHNKRRHDTAVSPSVFVFGRCLRKRPWYHVKNLSISNRISVSRWQNFRILNKRVNIWYWCGNHSRSHVTTINSKSSAHVYKDHLPNERYESFIEELSQATCTKSVDKHNSYLERLFAYMDQILKSKPNILTLAIEAFTLFLMNNPP